MRAVGTARRVQARPIQRHIVVRRGAVMAAAAPGGSRDLLIVGPGVLGSFAGKLWKELHPDANVVAQTNTASNHAR
jgi:hypothetical protein